MTIRPLTWLFWMLLILLVVSFVALVALLITQVIGQPLLTIETTLYPPLVTLAMAWVALVVWLWNVRRQYSEDMFRECQSFFEKSFKTLDVPGNGEPPENDRMRWLTSARLLKTAQKIGTRIELKGHRELYEDIEEYWRSRYYDLVEPHGNGLPEEYFRGRHDRRYPAGMASLDDRSLAAIFRFTNLHNEPLKDEPRFSDDEIEHMCKFGPSGLGNYLRGASNRTSP